MFRLFTRIHPAIVYEDIARCTLSAFPVHEDQALRALVRALRP